MCVADMPRRVNGLFMFNTFKMFKTKTHTHTHIIVIFSYGEKMINLRGWARCIRRRCF